MTGSNVETWRLPERMEVVYSYGTLHGRAAQPAAGNALPSSYLQDDGGLLPYDVPEVDLGGDVRLARSATGGLSIRSGRLREVLAEAETDARVKLRAK